MRFLDETLIEQYGSLPKKAKGELTRKFKKQFGFSDRSNRLNDLMLKKSQPTPEQNQFLDGQITTYWAFYNEQQPAEKL